MKTWITSSALVSQQVHQPSFSLTLIHLTTVWISPVSQNYQGPATPYGDAYHGRWIADATKLNDKFGTSDDLKSLSRELHEHGMSVFSPDAVLSPHYPIQGISWWTLLSTMSWPPPSPQTSPPTCSRRRSEARFLGSDLCSPTSYTSQSQFHPYCIIDWSNRTSEERCWLGDTAVPLADINTEDPSVVFAFSDWINSLVREYDIDGLRIGGLFSRFVVHSSSSYPI